MSEPSAPRMTEALFLAGAAGQRFCLYHRPAGPCRGAVLYLHPFGDEMNKSRRVAALQARALARLGYAVLQLDLDGCGDSSGEFGDARWDGWKDDVRRAAAWLGQRHAAPLSLWGLRLGAMLALDCARDPALRAARLVLWQPLQSGATYLTQFLRIRMANQMLAEGADTSGSGTKALRESLRAGETLEVGGYALAPAMADAIEAIDPPALAVRGCPVHWIDVVAEAGRPITPATARVTLAWEKAGVALTMHQAVGLQFWATQEIAECPALLETTNAIFAGDRP